MLRLVTIPISHYCEKARWGLDRAGLDYVEEPHLQIFHYPHALRASGGISVPALATGDARLGDSTDILTWIDRRVPDAGLYPAADAAEVRALEDRFDEALGPPARRLVYTFLLPERKMALGYNAAGVPRWERLALRALLPLARAFLRRRLRLGATAVDDDVARVAAVFDAVGAQLAGGRRYLVGEAFSAADMTFASLAAPVILPREYGVALPGLDEIPPGLRAIVERFRATPAGEFAQRLYRDDRRRSSILNRHPTGKLDRAWRTFPEV